MQIRLDRHSTELRFSYSKLGYQELCEEPLVKQRLSSTRLGRSPLVYLDHHPKSPEVAHLSVHLCSPYGGCRSRNHYKIYCYTLLYILLYCLYSSVTTRKGPGRRLFGPYKRTKGISFIFLLSHNTNVDLNLGLTDLSLELRRYSSRRILTEKFKEI